MSDTDWSRLFHAYGIATDIPDALAGLLGSEDEFYVAVDVLDGGVLHQGSIYPATPPAMELVLSALPQLTDTERITELLTLIYGAGQSAGWKEPTDDPEPDAAEIDVLFEGLAAGDEDAWLLPTVPAMRNDAYRRLRAMAVGMLDAVAPFLDHPDRAVRMAAVNAASEWVRLPAAATALPRIADRISARVGPAPADPAADQGARDERVTRVYALGRLGVDVAPWLTDPDPAVRAFVALHLPDDPAATAELVAALSEPEELDGWVKERPLEFRAWPRFTMLAEVIERRVPFADLLPAARKIIAISGAPAGDKAWGPFLPLAFPDGIPVVLTDDQRELLRALVANEELWGTMLASAKDPFRAVGLPYDRDAVAALAG